VEKHQTLKTIAVVSKVTDTVNRQFHDFRADAVVAARVVARGILLPPDQLVRLEKLPVSPAPDFVQNGGLEVD
jgi:hypothetical protein